MTEFDPNWPHGHITRDGRKARVICADRQDHVLPVIALVEREPGGEEAVIYLTAEGRSSSWDDSINLLNAPAPARTYYVNVYALPSGSIYTGEANFPTRALADVGGLTRTERIACIKITEGQFDD